MNVFSRGLLKSLKKLNLSVSKACVAFFSKSTTEIPRRHSFSFLEYFASCLENCTKADSLKKLHACVVTRGLEQNVYLGSKLLVSLARLNLLSESKCVFNIFVNDDLSFWNSIIVGYFRANLYNEILGLYLNLRRRNIGIRNSAVISVLKSCVELGNYQFGRSLHADVFRFGLNCDLFVCSSLIGFYSKCDQIGEAYKAFEEILDRDVVAYTSLITAYARVGGHYANDAFRVAVDMQKRGFEPNRVTLVSLLQCASQLGALEKGKSIHGYAIRKGIGSGDEVFETSLMDSYIKFGDLDKGSMIFDKMNTRSTTSWNALMAGHLQLGQPLEALNLFVQMVRHKCEPDLISLANGLLSSADLGYLIVGKSIHCVILRKGVHLDLVGATALTDMYSKCKHISGAMNVFCRADVKDGVLFSVMIAGYLYNGFVFKATETFHEMFTLCIKPSTSTFINVLSALSDLKDIRPGKSVHGYVFRQGLETNTDISNQIISMYAKCGLMRCAWLIFDRIKLKDRVSWTSIMTGLVNHDLADEAIALFPLMRRENIFPDSVTLTCLLQAFNHHGSVTLVTEVHAHLCRLFLEKDVTLMNSLITSYGKCGKLTMARNVFEHMTERHRSSWNTMIAAYGMNGQCVQALTLFDLMKKENLSPDSVTFKSILSACSHSGFVEEGLNAFWSIEEEHGIIPSDEHYGCVVDMLGRAGRLEEAYNLLRCVPSRQNASTLSALLAACRIHGNSEMGERVGKWLLDVEPRNTSAYCSVSNLYAGGGRWDELASLGAMAKGKGLKRIPGYSLIDVN